MKTNPGIPLLTRFLNVAEPRDAVKPTPSQMEHPSNPTTRIQVNPKEDDAVAAITKPSTTRSRSTKVDMAVATKPLNDKDATPTFSPRVMDLKNVATKRSTTRSRSTKADMQVATKPLNVVDMTPESSPKALNDKTVAAKASATRNPSTKDNMPVATKALNGKHITPTFSPRVTDLKNIATERSTTRSRSTKNDMADATKPDKDATPTFLPRVMDLKNVAAKASTTTGRSPSTKDEMAVATKPLNGIDMTPTFSPRVMDVNNVAAKASTTRSPSTKDDMQVAAKPLNDKDIIPTYSPRVMDVNNVAAAPATKDFEASTDETPGARSKAMAFDKVAMDDDPSFLLLNESTLTESSMDVSQNSDDLNLSQRTLFLRRRARERLVEEAKQKDTKEPVMEKKATAPAASSGTSRRRKMQKLLEMRDSQRSPKSVKNDATKDKAAPEDLIQGEPERASKGAEPRANTMNIQRKMQQLKGKRDLQKSLNSKPSESKDQTENAESRASATTTTFAEDPTIAPETTTAFAEDPTMAPETRPSQVSSIKLQKKAYSAAVAHKSINRRHEDTTEHETDLPQKTSAGEELGSKAEAMPRILPKDLDAIAEVPSPPDLIRMSSSFDIERSASSEGRGRSNSFDHPSSQILHSKVQELPASSTGTDLYMKRHRRQHDDKYDAIEDDERSRFSSISLWSGAKPESATYQQAQDTILPGDDENPLQELTEVVTVDDQDGEIEMVLPGGPGGALWKFEEADYSDGSDVNETTASCTDVTSDDLQEDESWADTYSQGDTNTLDSDDESRSYTDDESTCL